MQVLFSVKTWWYETVTTLAEHYYKVLHYISVVRKYNGVIFCFVLCGVLGGGYYLRGAILSPLRAYVQEAAQHEATRALAENEQSTNEQREETQALAARVQTIEQHQQELHDSFLAATEANARVADALLVSPTATPNTKAPGSALLSLRTATTQQLEELPGIGSKIAADIVAYRTQHGPFTKVEDLGEVKGIGDALLKKIAPLVQP
jgi:competence ComEA-like helix-hairpin-helix protein